MSELIDTSELTRFAAELAAAPVKLAAGLEPVVEHSAERFAARARADAPKDRPWLSTPEGIQVLAGDDPGSKVVATGLDPRGNPVGMLQEFGTSVMAPQPFFFQQEEPVADEFEAAAAVVADRVL